MLADDRESMREMLRRLLGEQGDFEVVAEARDVPAVVRHVKDLQPHVLVIDLSLPGQAGIEFLRRLHRQVPETDIVALSANADPVFARRALDAGVKGYVVKDADHDLVVAIRAVTRGERYLSHDIAYTLKLLDAASDVGRLTPRELEVLRLIALGYTSVEVAARLKLSARTIETHRARIQRKLEISTRAELVAYALRLGLVTSPQIEGGQQDDA